MGSLEARSWRRWSGERGLSPQRLAWAYRTVAPNGTPEEFEYLLRTNQPESEFDEPAVADLFARADPAPHSLADLGYLASVHPLELWVARYVMENPNAQRSQIIGESAQARQEVYRWLFQTSRQGAQDQRIRFLLEVEPFTEIHAGWRRLGYPFDNIVPSLGSAIGSSGDRPAALSDLVGIIVTGGVRLPRYQVEELHFAQRTPFETRMVREGAAGERVMPAEVAAVLRDAMIDVIENGTGRRMSGALHGPDGSLLTGGGKDGDRRQPLPGLCPGRKGGRVAEREPHLHPRLLHRRPILRRDHGVRPRRGGGRLHVYERPSRTDPARDGPDPGGAHGQPPQPGRGAS